MGGLLENQNEHYRQCHHRHWKLSSLFTESRTLTLNMETVKMLELNSPGEDPKNMTRILQKNVFQRLDFRHTISVVKRLLPAQRNSGMYKLAGSAMGSMGSMEQRHKTKNSPAQRRSKMSIFKSMGERVDDSMGKTETKNIPAQRDSGNYKLKIDSGKYGENT